MTAEPAAAVRGPRGPYRSGQARRREILAAASAVFAVDGYRGGSLRDVARALDLSPGLILHHFGSKEQLLVAVLEDRDLVSHLPLAHVPASGGFVAALGELIEANQAKPGLMMLFTTLSAEAVNPDHPAHGFFTERYARITRYLADGLEAEAAAGLLTLPHPAEEVASSVLAVMDGLQLQWLLTRDFSLAQRFTRTLRAMGLLPGA